MKPLIITSAGSQKHPSDWKNQFKSSAKLAPQLESTQFSDEYQAYLKQSGCTDQFPLRLPHSFVSRMLKQPDWQSVLRQFIPDPHEHQVSNEYIADPVGDLLSVKTRGLLHKYDGRALIVTTGICPVHCRYCFRRNFDYHDRSAHKDHFKQALQYIANEKDIHEVILSGGDPLSLEDKILHELMENIQRLPHISTIRLHTRYPIIIPSRITRHLLQHFKQIGNSLRLVMVLHSNHPHEIDRETHSAIQSLRKVDVTMLNQSVLLKNVNDDAETLIQLSRKLHRAGVLPYYLHLLDPVSGSQRFDLELQVAENIYQQMQNSLPGYLLPRMVREIAGKPAKQLIYTDQ